MATVRMARQVQEDIISSAKKAFQTTNPYQQFEVTLGDRVYNELYKPQAEELINKVRSLEHIVSNSTFEKQSHISVALQGIDVSEHIDPSNDNDYGRDTFYGSINIPMTQKRRFFETRNENVLIPDTHTLHIEIVRMLDTNELTYTSMKEHISKIQEIIDSCVTINQFLKAWPAGAAHVPQDKLQKANERSVRKQQADERRALVEGMESDLNTTILTSSLLED